MPRRDPELCQKIRHRVDKWDKYWNINRKMYYEWVDFIMGDQWREDEAKLFERYNKIPLMFNKLGVLMNHMKGDQIQNTPNLQIQPDSDVPPDTAQARAALIKNISLSSDAKSIYQTAYGQAIVGGYSAYRVGSEFLNNKSFDQEIMIYGFTDPNQCYWDLSAKHISKFDGMFSGFRTRISRKFFRDLYGKDLESQIGSSSITEDTMLGFADDDSITQIDDFERVGKKSIIRKLSNGDVVTDEEYRKLDRIEIDGKKWLLKDGVPVSIIDRRDVVNYTIKHRQIAGDFVLKETDFPSEHLPIIFVDQDSYYTKQGQQITRSFFKDVKDAQKYLNYLATQSAYIMKISRYDQFMAPRKCISAPDTQQIWRDPSVVQGALWYDEVPSGEKPEQLRPPELSQSLTLQYERTLVDIQSGTGLYNTQIGEMGNEVSGEAIRRRNVRGNKNTQISRTSLDISIASGGIVINEMIPTIYDTERTLVLPMANSEEEKVPINHPGDEYGLSMINDMTEGRYKIRLKPGPSYEGQKEEALESLQLVLNADRAGQVFPMIADLYAENLPLDNNIEIRNRLRTLVPQEIIEAGKTGKPLPPKQSQPDPEMMLIEIKKQELQQKAKQAEQEAQSKAQELQLKQAELQRKAIESHQDMTIAWERLEAEKAEAAAELQETILRYQGEAARIGADLHINHTQNIMKLLTHTSKHKQSEIG